MLADNAIDLLPDSEVKLNLRLSLTGVDEVVIAFGPGATPQCPGHGVNEGGFATAVVAADAGGMDTGEIERWHIVPVGHEIAQG
jgi:hypothetical protein